MRTVVSRKRHSRAGTLEVSEPVQHPVAMAEQEPLPDWLDHGFPDEFLPPVDLESQFTAEENQMLLSLFDMGNGNPEGLASVSAALEEEICDGADGKKVVLASAAAAGLRSVQGGLKHAFSTGDLHQNQVSRRIREMLLKKRHMNVRCAPSLMPPSPDDILTSTSLESVPEGAVLKSLPVTSQQQGQHSQRANALNLCSLSTEQLEQELSRRKGSAPKIQDSVSQSTDQCTAETSLPIAAPSSVTAVPTAAYVPTAMLHRGFRSVVDPFGQRSTMHQGMVQATAMGSMGSIAGCPTMIPAALAPIQGATVMQCHPGIVKAVPSSSYYVQEGNFMVPGMAPQEAIQPTGQQQIQKVPNSSLQGVQAMPQRVLMSQPPQAIQVSTSSQMPPPASTPVEPASQSCLRKSQSTPALSTLNGVGPAASMPASAPDRVTDVVEAVKIGRLTAEERRQKVLRYKQKRHERKFEKRVTYQCRKTLADSRPRVRGRFARNDDQNAVMPHQTKKARLAREATTDPADEARIRSTDGLRGVQLHAHPEIVPKVEPTDANTSLENFENLLRNRA